IYHWTSLSNRIGRKPVVIIGVSGVCISAAAFGFSRSLPALIIARSLAGALSGNVAVVSTMLSEITDETNQSRAFPLLSATWYIGSVIGPLIGGNLSNPAKKWPKTFEKYPIFKEYPYLLPSLVASLLCIVAVILCILFVEETLPSKVGKKAKSSGPTEVETVMDPSSTEPEAPAAPAPPKPKGELASLLARWEILSLVCSGFVFHFLGAGFEVVFVLYSYTQVKLGGMGLSPQSIGWALAVSGAIGTFIALVLFPFVQRRYNNRLLYMIFSCFWAITFALAPLGHLAATVPDEAKRTPLLWGTITLILLPIRLGISCAPLGMILVKASVETPEQMSTLFGLQQAFFSVGRGLSPAVVSTLFAFSMEKHIMGGNFVWVVLFIIALSGIPFAWGVKNVPAPMSAGRK
ncbi:MFS general substrate transporter, partial [Clavulina sp. PMI_390]